MNFEPVFDQRAPCRSDRNAKYNELIRIVEELGDTAVYGGVYWNR